MYSFLVFILILAGVAIFCWRREQDWWLEKKRFDKLSSLLPFDRVLDDKVTVICKDYTIFRVLKINPVDYAILSKEAQVTNSLNRKTYFNEMAEHNAHIRFFTIRNKKHNTKPAKYPNAILQQIHDAWTKVCSNAYENNHYMVLSVRPGKFSKKDKSEATDAAIGKMNILTELTMDTFTAFDPTLVKHENKYSPLLTFLARLAVFQNEEIPSNNNVDVGTAITTSEVEFLKEGAIEVHGKYIKAINLEAVGETLNTDFIDEVLRKKSELVMYYSLKGRSKMKSLNNMDIFKGLPQKLSEAERSTDRTKSVPQHKEVINLVKNDEVRMYEFQLTIFVESPTKEECIQTTDEIRRLFRHYDMVPAVAKHTIKHLYLSMFPSIEQQIYSINLMSSVMAYLLKFPGDPKGLQRSSFGEGGLIECPTANNDIYTVNVHATEGKNDEGHSISFGKIGRGKTFWWSHLIAGATRNGVKSYILDRLQGTKVFTLATGGKYVTLNNMMNPFVLDDTPYNRLFIENLLLMMSNCQQDDLSRQQLSYAMNCIFRLPKEHRILNDIVAEIIPDGKLKRALHHWTGNNAFGHWFNGVDEKGHAFDALNLSGSNIVSFDMTDIQESSEVSACATYYIMRRIRQEIGAGSPHIIFIDEAAPQLQNEQFRQEVSVVLHEHRKKNGVVALNFQHGQQIIECGLEKALQSQIATQFFYTNKGAKREDFANLKLSDYEWAYIKEELPISKKLERSVMVKKDNETVILNADKSGMGELIKLFSSDGDNAKLAEDLKRQYGDDLWVKEYLVRAT